jgi:hypothetical protein
MTPGTGKSYSEKINRILSKSGLVVVFPPNVLQKRYQKVVSGVKRG